MVGRFLCTIIRDFISSVVYNDFVMAFSDPQKNIEQFGLQDGVLVADLGAGAGAYTVAAALAVAPLGRVYAVEVQKEYLSKIKDVVSEAGLSNVDVLWGDIERSGKTKIGDRVVDAVIVANVLFQVEDKDGMTAEVKRILKPGGRVLLVDWKDSFDGMGPHSDEIISYDTAKKVFEDAGFIFVKDIDAGDNHYGFVMKK